MNLWQELGIAPTQDRAQIRRAYAARLKQVHPEDDPEGFQHLRSAYERALALCTHAAAAAPAGTGAPDHPSPTAHTRMAPLAAPASPPQRAASPVAPLAAAAAVAPAAEPLPVLPHPAAAARGIVLAVLQAPSENRAALLKQLIRQRGWESLDFQIALEDALQRELLVYFGHYVDCLRYFVEFYAWRDPQRHIVANSAALRELMSRYTAWRWCEQPEDLSSITATARRVRTALQLLRAPPDEAAFRRFARRLPNMRSMEALLAHLRSKWPAVLHYEIDRASLQWWQTALQRPWLTLEEQLQPLPIYLLLGVLVWVYSTPAYDPNALPTTTAAILLRGLFATLSAALPYAAHLAFRHWHHRHGAETRRRFERWRTRSREHPRHRRILLTLTALCFVLPAGDRLWPALDYAAIPAIGLLAFWSGLRLAISTVLLLAWPIHIVLFVLWSAILEQWPELGRSAFPAPFSIFMHGLSAVLYVTLARWTEPLSRRLNAGKPTRYPRRVAFLGTLSLCIVLLMTRGPHLKPHTWTPPAAERPAPASTDNRPPAALRSVTPKSRDIKDIDPTIQAHRGDFSAAFRPYLRRHPQIISGQIELAYTVMPDGSVRDAQVTHSDFIDTEALNKRFIACISTLNFGARPGSAATRFSIRFGTPATPTPADTARQAPR